MATTSEALPPGFKIVPSRSRQGEICYQDTQTGKKYGTVLLAWTVHRETLSTPEAQHQVDLHIHHKEDRDRAPEETTTGQPLLPVEVEPSVQVEYLSVQESHLPVEPLQQEPLGVELEESHLPVDPLQQEPLAIELEPVPPVIGETQFPHAAFQEVAPQEPTRAEVLPVVPQETLQKQNLQAAELLATRHTITVEESGVGVGIGGIHQVAEEKINKNYLTDSILSSIYGADLDELICYSKDFHVQRQLEGLSSDSSENVSIAVEEKRRREAHDRKLSQEENNELARSPISQRLPLAPLSDERRRNSFGPNNMAGEVEGRQADSLPPIVSARESSKEGAPPGFEQVASASRPGEFAYIDKKTGGKYGKSQAWKVYERRTRGDETADQAPPGWMTKASTSRAGHVVFIDPESGKKYGELKAAWQVYNRRRRSQGLQPTNPASGSEGNAAREGASSVLAVASSERTMAPPAPEYDKENKPLHAPPGFEPIPSRSRPGYSAYVCLETGRRYGTLELAWKAFHDREGREKQRLVEEHQEEQRAAEMERFEAELAEIGDEADVAASKLQGAYRQRGERKKKAEMDRFQAELDEIGEEADQAASKLQGAYRQREARKKKAEWEKFEEELAENREERDQAATKLQGAYRERARKRAVAEGEAGVAGVEVVTVDGVDVARLEGSSPEGTTGIGSAEVAVGSGTARQTSRENTASSKSSGGNKKQVVVTSKESHDHAAESIPLADIPASVEVVRAGKEIALTSTEENKTTTWKSTSELRESPRRRSDTRGVDAQSQKKSAVVGSAVSSSSTASTRTKTAQTRSSRRTHSPEQSGTSTAEEMLQQQEALNSRKRFTVEEARRRSAQANAVRRRSAERRAAEEVAAAKLRSPRPRTPRSPARPSYMQQTNASARHKEAVREKTFGEQLFWIQNRRQSPGPSATRGPDGKRRTSRSPSPDEGTVAAPSPVAPKTSWCNSPREKSSSAAYRRRSQSRDSAAPLVAPNKEENHTTKSSTSAANRRGPSSGPAYVRARRGEPTIEPPPRTEDPYQHAPRGANTSTTTSGQNLSVGQNINLNDPNTNPGGAPVVGGGAAGSHSLLQTPLAPSRPALSSPSRGRFPSSARQHRSLLRHADAVIMDDVMLRESSLQPGDPSSAVGVVAGVGGRALSPGILLPPPGIHIGPNSLENREITMLELRLRDLSQQKVRLVTDLSAARADLARTQREHEEVRAIESMEARMAVEAARAEAAGAREEVRRLEEETTQLRRRTRELEEELAKTRVQLQEAVNQQQATMMMGRAPGTAPAAMPAREPIQYQRAVPQYNFGHNGEPSAAPAPLPGHQDGSPLLNYQNSLYNPSVQSQIGLGGHQYGGAQPPPQQLSSPTGQHQLAMPPMLQQQGQHNFQQHQQMNTGAAGLFPQQVQGGHQQMAVATPPNMYNQHVNQSHNNSMGNSPTAGLNNMPVHQQHPHSSMSSGDPTSQQVGGMMIPQQQQGMPMPYKNLNVEVQNRKLAERNSELQEKVRKLVRIVENQRKPEWDDDWWKPEQRAPSTTRRKVPSKGNSTTRNPGHAAGGTQYSARGRSVPPASPGRGRGSRSRSRDEVQQYPEYDQHGGYNNYGVGARSMLQ
ncbi:unnamed protein product [Amoebophrya sp. A25]|nr:unnamed protein product [Amoebophrya sp. A25]|eukprot:GSA25T00017264001.1